MGGLIQFMPFTYTVMLIGTIALLGLPWLSGFYSKDLILELAYGKYQFSSIFAFILGTLTAFLTAFYSLRLINLVYLTVPNANKTSYLNIHSENLIVIVPLSLLALFAIFLGFVASDFVGIGSDFFGSSLFYHPTQVHIIEAEFSLPLYIKLLPTILSLFGAGLAVFVYHFGHKYLTASTQLSWRMPLAQGVQAKSISEISTRAPLFLERHTEKQMNNGVLSLALGQHAFSSLGEGTRLFVTIYTFLNGKYFLDILYNNYLISGGLKAGYTISKILDKGIIELIGPFGLTEGSYTASNKLSKLDTGVITTYALYITLGLISILFILFSPFFFDVMNSTSTELGINSLQLNTLHIARGAGEHSNTFEANLTDTALGAAQGLSIYNISFKILLISIFSTFFVFIYASNVNRKY